MAFLRALLVLLGCLVVGEALAAGFALPVPGPVLGLLVLAIALASGRLPAAHDVRATSHALLRHLSLLFVPAGAGIVGYGAALEGNVVAVVVAVLVSTVATLAVSVLVFLVGAGWWRRHGPAAASGGHHGAGPAQEEERHG